MQYDQAMSPADRAKLERLPDHVLLGLTAFLEARSEPVLGIVAVMFTVINRMAKGHRGRSVQACCLWPAQYSCWNDHDPQQIIGLRLAELLLKNESLEHQPDAIVLSTCLALAAHIVHRYPWPVPDPSDESTHYLNPNAVARMPDWTKPETGAIQTVRIGAHTFYRHVA